MGGWGAPLRKIEWILLEIDLILPYLRAKTGVSRLAVHCEPVYHFLLYCTL